MHKRLPTVTGNPKVDAQQLGRMTEASRKADMAFIDSLVECRTLSILQLNEKKSSRFRKEELHVKRLKELRHEELMRSRGMDIPTNEDPKQTKNKYSNPSATLSAHDLELIEGLESTQQNYCLSDPRLPDNPIVYASQAFLNMTGWWH